MKYLCLVLLSTASIVFSNGCLDPRITNTGRSAVEQTLLATAIERGVGLMPFDEFAGRAAFVDYGFLASQVDKEYVQAMFDAHLTRSGVRLTADKTKAAIIVKVSCGVLATDSISFNLGTPRLPIPLPYTEISFAIPEISLLRKVSRTGSGRFNAVVSDAVTGDYLTSYSGVNSRTIYNNWVVFFFIPFSSRDIEFAEPGRTTAHFLE